MRAVPSFRTYLNADHAHLWERLAEVCNDISTLSQEIGLAEADQLRFRAQAFARSDQGSATARAQEAEVATSTVSSTLVELHAERASLIEEKFFIVRLLDA